MKVSVVTVCYNSEKTIEATINSVLEQTYQLIEYLIIDGQSEDDTMSVVQKYSNINANMVVLSEPDDGLYDAMNKAASLATGEYIIYMNSGDRFADKYVIEKVVPFLYKGYDMVYGNVIRYKSWGPVLEKYSGPYKELRLLMAGQMMCHQSMFTKTRVMKTYGFDLKYSITADYNFVMQIVHDKKNILYLNDITVSEVDNVVGISSEIANMDEMRHQDDMSLKNNFPLLFYMVYPLKYVARTIRRRKERNY